MSFTVFFTELVSCCVRRAMTCTVAVTELVHWCFGPAM
jgi:hypothetical protein